MSDDANEPEVDILINGKIPNNKLSYVLNQAKKNNQVLSHLSIKVKTLIDWGDLKQRKESTCTYIQILNSCILGNAFQIDTKAQRIEDRLRLEVRRSTAQVKKLNRIGNKKQRENLLHSRKQIAILHSDIVTNQQYQKTISCLERQTKDLEEDKLALEIQVKKWSKEYANLDESKQKLFDDIREQHTKIIHETEQKNRAMVAHINNIERLDQRISTKATALSTLSTRQKRRRIDEFSSNARTALWFSSAFGFHLHSLFITDGHAVKYKINLKADTPSKDTPSNSETGLHEPSAQAVKHYEQLTADEKTEVECLLFLIDKFGVSDSFVHELGMVFQELPRPYLVKECRKKINAKCFISPTPGDCPGAQVSFKKKLQDKLRSLKESGYLKENEPVKIKVSGDGARMTRLTGFVLLSFAVLEKKDEILSSQGTTTVAVLAGSECYQSMKIGFGDAIREINEVIQQGIIELEPGYNVPVKIFLGGDYKFLLIVNGRRGAIANHSCIWCKIHKDDRWDMSKGSGYYNTPPMTLTLANVQSYAENGNNEYCCVEQPLFNIPLDHVILDELHLLLRITDVLLANVLDDAMERDEKEDNLRSRGMEKGVNLKAIITQINSCGVTFRIWEKQDTAKGTTVMDWTSLMGNEKKKLLTLLPEQLVKNTSGVHGETKDTVVQIWKDFADIYQNTISAMEPKLDGKNYFQKIREWVILFLSLSKKRKGYGKTNVTPYIHAAVYHVANVIKEFGNIKQFSGQGVEKNNDVARNVVRRKCNNWDSAADVLRTEHRQTTLCHRKRVTRTYTKKDEVYWKTGKSELCNKRKSECVSNVVVNVEPAEKRGRRSVTGKTTSKKTTKNKKKVQKRKNDKKKHS